MDLTKTVFGDFRQKAVEMVRAKTDHNTYLIAFHEERGRKYVVVRGVEGTDRENLVVRDSDPRVGDESMFDLPVTEWIGKPLEFATVRTSPVVTATVEPLDAAALGAGFRGAGHVDPPAGLGEAPRIQPVPARGTGMGQSQPLKHLPHNTVAHNAVIGAPTSGAQEPPVPYPVRHVMYAENVAALLRSIVRRESLVQDIASDPGLRLRLQRALDESDDLMRVMQRRLRG